MDRDNTVGGEAPPRTLQFKEKGIFQQYLHMHGKHFASPGWGLLWEGGCCKAELSPTSWAQPISCFGGRVENPQKHSGGASNLQAAQHIYLHAVFVPRGKLPKLKPRNPQQWARGTRVQGCSLPQLSPIPYQGPECLRSARTVLSLWYPITLFAFRGFHSSKAPELLGEPPPTPISLRN